MENDISQIKRTNSRAITKFYIILKWNSKKKYQFKSVVKLSGLGLIKYSIFYILCYTLIQTLLIFFPFFIAKFSIQRTFGMATVFHGFNKPDNCVCDIQLKKCADLTHSALIKYIYTQTIYMYYIHRYVHKYW